MIKKINRIKGFGIFKDFTWSSDLDDFKRFSLFYGWNGSGKTTFSKLFTMIEQKNDLNLFKNLSNYEFTLTNEDSSILDQNTYQTNEINLYVYNEIFKEKNIDWNNVIKSILLISNTMITEKTELDSKKNELGKEDNPITVLGKIKKLKDDNTKTQKDLDDFYSKSAKSIKEEFKVIDTSDTYYFNYNKTKFKNFIDSYLKEIQNKENMLESVEVDKLKQSIKPNILDRIELNLKNIELLWLEKVQSKVLDVVKTSLIVNEVQRLKEHPQIGAWVEKGIEIHNFYNSKKCEFCNQNLPKERLEELEKHFSDEYIKLKEKIQMAIDWLPQQKISHEIFESEIDFYPEYEEEFKGIKKEIKKSIDKINELFDSWLKSLKKKKDNPFKIIENIVDIESKQLQEYNDLINKLKNLIKQHNYKTENFKEKSKILKSNLELHYSTTLYHDFGLKKKTKTIVDNDNKLEELILEKKILEKDIKALEAKLSDEAFGAKEFNEKLHRFLGRDNIYLEFDKDLKGYKIIRDGIQASNLSEGERTAIAFVYFITKIKENENKVEDSIIVVDDPISSFDSNNLFSAYSFLKNECGTAKQLFIITHNFAYFKLIRDWFDPTKGSRTSIYTIEASSISGARQSSIINAKSSLTKYQSEYQYIFSRLYQYKDAGVINIDNAYLVGNLSRKLLEAFFSFKFPRKRKNFRELMDFGINDKELLEKVYKFINKYSHNQNVEFYDSSDDNILSESTNIVNDILEKIIKKTDENHYKEMVEIVQN